MTSSAVWLVALGPLALFLVYGLAGALRLRPRATSRLALGAAGLTLALALGATLLVVTRGKLVTPALGIDGYGFGLYIDRLSICILCLVAFVGLVVLHYSASYMQGDRQEGRFTRLLCLTLGSVLMVAISGNLLQFVLAWAATSISLNRLLLFYPERANAQLAARKKFIVSRAGDLCLIGALLIVHHDFGSLDFSVMFAKAHALRITGGVPDGMGFVAFLIVVAGLLKSAQFPTHGWLLEVMETPTPVSALLHAGIINAGGFLVLRFAGIVSLSVPSLDLLAVVGGFTALFGSIVMLTQTSVKVSLACSTVAQMGFMMLECGLGAFSAALLHIVAHSLYKAHAFLSSGSVIDIARASYTPSPGGRPHPWRLVFAIIVVIAIAFLFGSLTGATIAREPGVVVLGAILLLSLTHLVAGGIDEMPHAFVILRVIGFALVVAALYFALQFLTAQAMLGALPRTATLRGPFGLAIIGLVIGSFALITYLQGLAAAGAIGPRFQAFYAHVNNGLYVNTWLNRLVLAYSPSLKEAARHPAPLLGEAD